MGKIAGISLWGGGCLKFDLLKIISCCMIVYLHCNVVNTIQNGQDYISLVLHCMTRFAVPVFMGISGYFLFFNKSYSLKQIYLKKLPHLILLFTIWLLIYAVWNYHTSGSEEGLIQYILINNDGWHLWYIKVYIGLIIIYPVMSAITKNEIAVKTYCILWIVFVSIRFTLGILLASIPKVYPYLSILQIPFFHYHGYIGGTVAGNYPTEFIGPFIVLGYYIWLLEEKRISNRVGNLMIGLGVCGLLITILATVLASIQYGIFTDYFCAPIEIQIVLFAVCVITVIFRISEVKLRNHASVLTRISEYTQGVYIMHPIIKQLLVRNISDISRSSLISSISIWLITVFITFFAVALLRRGIPEKLRKCII